MSIASHSTPTVLYLSHGGGPMPLLGDKGHAELIENLKNIPTLIEKPTAIVIISAHWEEKNPTLTSGKNPSLIYDYYGFPKQAYDIKYPAKGEPNLAANIQSIFNKHGINADLDDQRGFDHGVFVPLKIMYPDADIPCVQLSLANSLDPKAHINMGKALGEINYKGLLIIGSGFSFHNMNAFFGPAESDQKNEAFEEWLIDTCANKNINEAEREHKLEGWQQAPFAKYCHPREEHLLPLHVCYGAAKRACSKVFVLNVLGKKVSSYLWNH